MEHIGDAAWLAGAVVAHNEPIIYEQFWNLLLYPLLVMLQHTYISVIFAKHSDYIYKFCIPFGFVDLDFSLQQTQSMLVCRFCFQ